MYQTLTRYQCTKAKGCYAEGQKTAATQTATAELEGCLFFHFLEEKLLLLVKKKT